MPSRSSCSTPKSATGRPYEVSFEPGGRATPPTSGTPRSTSARVGARRSRGVKRSTDCVLCAFSNAGGGRVLIGVEDDGSIVGAEGWDEQRVMNIAGTMLDPPIVPAYQRIVWQGDKPIVVVAADQGAEKPYAVGGGEGRRYFIRVGSTSREPSSEGLIRLTQASGAVAGDLRPVIGATAEDLDDALLAARFAGRRTIRWWDALPPSTTNPSQPARRKDLMGRCDRTPGLF
ncbi:MAG: AlbA family DNA-binding domain-containing protein [Thermoleophilaceae bacterium]